MTGQLELILEHRIIPVARGLTQSKAVSVGQALAAGGLPIIEVTMESGNGAASIRALQDSDLLVGAGTLASVAQAEEAQEAGAVFFVSPHLDDEIAIWASDNQVTYLPGVFTPTEVARAVRLGARAVKLFPATTGGPSHVRIMKGPYPDLVVVPTGGITDANAGDFIDAGAAAVGVGGWLTDHDDSALITDRARLLRRVVQVV